MKNLWLLPSSIDLADTAARFLPPCISISSFISSRLREMSTIASREWIEDNTKVTIPANKRNYRKQKDHVKVMNTMKALKKQLGEEVKEGRPKGSGTAEQTVREWQESHPAGKKADCIRETGLSKPTVYKWWK